MNLITRLLVNAAALWAAAYVVDGMSLTGDWMGILIVAAIFGVVNAIIRPIVTLLSLPALLLTLGLFTLVINAIMLQITDALTESLTVDGGWTGIVAALVISVVSWALSSFLGDGKDKDKQRKRTA